MQEIGNNTYLIAQSVRTKFINIFNSNNIIPIKKATQL